MIDATPRPVDAEQIDPTGRYKCPLCLVQTTASKPDIGWVFCPMIDNQPICVGSCLDHQNIANSQDFDGHPFRNDFDSLSERTGREVSELRLICLRHQESVLVAELEQNEYPALEKNIREWLKDIREVMKLME